MRLRQVKSEKGFTIIEVLISAVVFVIGFSLLIALISNVVSRFSIKELIIADNIGHEIMTSTIMAADSMNLDTVIARSGYKYKVKKITDINNNLRSVTVIISRAGSQRELLKLYDEYTVFKKP